MYPELITFEGRTGTHVLAPLENLRARMELGCVQAVTAMGRSYTLGDTVCKGP